jgi:hypothetical protein
MFIFERRIIMRGFREVERNIDEEIIRQEEERKRANEGYRMINPEHELSIKELNLIMANIMMDASKEA